MTVTIHELAVHRLRAMGKIGEGEPGSMSGQDYFDAGLDIMGGCQVCEASLACYNGYPSKSGYWKCRDCIDGDGWESAVEADTAIFGAPA